MSLIPNLIAQLLGDPAQSRWKGKVLSGIGVISLASGWYLSTDLGLELQRTDVCTPPASWEVAKEDGKTVLRPNQEYLAYYMQEFSKAYFGHPANQFEALSRMPMEVKTVYKNQSHGKARTLASIEAVVTPTAKASFPWELLDVAARVERQGPLLESTGVGPPLDVQWRFTSSAMALGEGEARLLDGDGINLYGLVRPVSGDDPVFLGSARAPGITSTSATEGRLTSPLYLRLPSGVGATLEISPSSPNCVDTPLPATAHGWYQELTSVDDLRRLTPTTYEEPADLVVKWHAIDGTPGELRETVTTPSGTVYWQPRPDLYESDPRCVQGGMRVPPMEGGAGTGGFTGGGVGMLPLAEALAGDHVAPPLEGLDTYTTHLEASLQDIPVHGRATAAAYPDVILNPQGLLFVYLRMTGLAGLRYTYTLRVEGEAVSSFDFTVLEPESLSFMEEGPENAIRRLSAVFGARP